jgi:hypothetical protein
MNKRLNQLMGSQPSPLTNWISNGDTYINKRYKNPAQTCFHPIRPHTIANMNDSVSLAMHTRGTRRKFLFIHIRGGAVLVVIFGLTTTYAISAFHNLSGFLYLLFIYVSPLEIQLVRGDGWDPINWFNPTTVLWLYKARTWISNAMCRGLFCVE